MNAHVDLRPTRHALTRLRERFPELARAADRDLAYLIRTETRDARQAGRVLIIPARGRYLLALAAERAYVIRDGHVITTLRGPLQ